MSGIIENLGNAVNSVFRGKAPQVASQKLHTVPWGLEAFPDDGSGRTLHIKTGDTLQFVPIDDELHNVAEADVVDDRWLPSRERQLGVSYRTRRGLNEQLKINKAGTYHLTSPISGQHEVMRLTVIAQSDAGQQVKTRLDQAKQQARQAVTEAKQRADEARQALAQAQQQRTEAAQQRAQQAAQRAQQAHEKAQDALQGLGDLARELGQDAAQVVNEVVSGVQQGVQNVANQAMNIVTSLANPLRQIGPLGPVNKHILDSVQILQGTGTFASRFPNFDLGQFNILDQNRVVGPLGPVIKRRNNGQATNGQRGQNGTASTVPGAVPTAVMVDDEEEEIATFGPAYNEQRRQARRLRRERRQGDQRPVTVRWDSNSLSAPNGSVRTLQIPEGTTVVFRSTDGRPHNLVETNANFTQKQNPLIDTRANTTEQLNESLQMDKAGTYYFTSTTDPQSMRLIVKVNPADPTDEIINGA